MARRKSKKLNLVSKAKSKIQKRKSVRNKKSRKRTYRKNQKGGAENGQKLLNDAIRCANMMTVINSNKKKYFELVIYDSLGNKFYLYHPKFNFSLRAYIKVLLFKSNAKESIDIPFHPYKSNVISIRQTQVNEPNSQDLEIEQLKSSKQVNNEYLSAQIINTKVYATEQHIHNKSSTKDDIRNLLFNLKQKIQTLLKLIDDLNSGKQEITYHFKLTKMDDTGNIKKKLEWCQDLISFIASTLEKPKVGAGAGAGAGDAATDKYLIGKENKNTYAFSYVSPTVCRLDIKRDLIEGLGQKLNDIKGNTSTNATPPTTTPTTPTSLEESDI